uniref:Uncharacterized protein n=1 Tax=Oryza sativa subsp. japonica TaxID=39947 RepID=Q6ZDR5_ORYSJ|nr:hypothetical protein [Oryza sativa Japonica Group]
MTMIADATSCNGYPHHFYMRTSRINPWKPILRNKLGTNENLELQLVLRIQLINRPAPGRGGGGDPAAGDVAAVAAAADTTLGLLLSALMQHYDPS